MIIGVLGLPGSGKSYFLTSEILKYLRKTDCTVISNFHPTKEATSEFGERWQFGLWRDMIEAPYNTICVVDEANMWFNSRDWKGQSSSDLAVFKQSRKNGIHLWWCDQHENRVDVAIREVTHWYYRVERFYFWSTINIEEPTSGKKTGRMLRLRNDEVWKYYDSYENIGDRLGNGYGRGRAADKIKIEHDKRLYRYPGLIPNTATYTIGPIIGRSDGECTGILLQGK